MIYFHKYVLYALRNPKRWKKGVYRREGLVGDYKFLKRSHEYAEGVRRRKERMKQIEGDGRKYETI